jgi:hypothetical protein
MDRSAKKPNVLDLGTDLNFCDARIEELSKGLSDLPSAPSMTWLINGISGIMSALEETEEDDSVPGGRQILAGKNLEKLVRRVEAHKANIEKISNYRANVQDILGVQRQKASLIETEIRRRIADGNMVPTEQVATLCVQLVDIFLGIMKDAREINEAATKVKSWQTRTLAAGPMASLLEGQVSEKGASGAMSREELIAAAEHNARIDARDKEARMSAEERDRIADGEDIIEAEIVNTSDSDRPKIKLRKVKR